jgi:SAM-dependent methyltransferase
MPELREDSLPFGHGFFDRVELANNHIDITGWMLFPDRRLDRFLLFINKKFISEIEICEREDVEKVFPFVQYAKYSGFTFSNGIDEELGAVLDVCVVGMQGQQQVGKLQTLYLKGIHDDSLDIKTNLVKRVTGQEDSRAFWQSGLKTFQDYWGLICKYRDPKSIDRLLDWGCGPGRLIRTLIELTTIAEIHGCDIDSEAIQWSRNNIVKAEFNAIPAFPPTAYADGYFDVIIGNSIFTHLKRDVQIAWLKEIRRILKPDGLLLASVHGEFATYLKFPHSVKEILKEGISDQTEDNILEGVAPKGYYRGTFQSYKYTKEVFGQYLEILDYVERGSYHFQDIVVMKKSHNTANN